MKKAIKPKPFTSFSIIPAQLEFEILTTDSIEIQCCQTAATHKRTPSDGSNIVRNGNRSQTAATGKRPISDRGNAGRNGNRSQIAVISDKVCRYSSYTVSDINRS